MKSISKKKAVYLSAAIAVFVVVRIYFDIHSEWFEFATHWARQSSEVHQVVGDVIDVSSFPSSWSYKYNDTQGFAQCAFTLSGTRGKAKMHVQLQKILGKWHLVAATLNGSELTKLE